MARPERFELPTKWFEATYSIQLSYGRTLSSIVMPKKGQIDQAAIIRRLLDCV